MREHLQGHLSVLNSEVTKRIELKNNNIFESVKCAKDLLDEYLINSAKDKI